MNKRMIVAVDGTSASGKSACRIVAQKLGFSLLETGVIYRAMTLMVLRSKIDPYDTDSVIKLVECNRGRLSFWGNQLTLDGQMVGDEVRTPEIDAVVHHVAKLDQIRNLVLPLQRSFNEGTRIVAEGRDIGSVVFPDAQVKFFLTADLDVRAERRLNQYQENNPAYPGSFQEVMDDLDTRDQQDMNRTSSPLVCLPDAYLIKTTKMTKEQVIELMLAECTRKGLYPD
jgi:CMP/dCMP kinase